MHVVDYKEINELLFAISDGKATGAGGITVRFLKLCSAVTVPIITHIVNVSIISCIVPDDWKVAEVIPLFKDGDRTDSPNYHPISILPAISKVL